MEVLDINKAMFETPPRCMPSTEVQLMHRFQPVMQLMVNVKMLNMTPTATAPIQVLGREPVYDTLAPCYCLKSQLLITFDIRSARKIAVVIHTYVVYSAVKQTNCMKNLCVVSAMIPPAQGQ